MDAFLRIVDDDSSDDEILLNVMRSCAKELDQEAVEGSSQRPPRGPHMYLHRDREGASQRLWNGYFTDNPTFPDHKFKRRFRMQPQLFMCIITVGLRYMGDIWDEYLHMSEQTSLNCLDNFCVCVTDLYQKKYLRKPTAHDIQRIYASHETKHGFREMLGSIDCMHCFNNDINVLNRSSLFDSNKNGTIPPSPFIVNGHDYTHGYYLVDSIYPEWATLVKAYSSPTNDPAANFTRFQESARKDVERTFGVLQENNGFAITSFDEEYLREPENQHAFVRNRNSNLAT
ncbi:uncharacterized protein [Rutidosis leptorrhynchoides]|uniref:uncharacterized protein n=1 Tax=Rutidosis leptorrhynchoides TaxID=125765 RepID=UPI003A9A48FA